MFSCDFFVATNFSSFPTFHLKKKQRHTVTTSPPLIKGVTHTHTPDMLAPLLYYFQTLCLNCDPKNYIFICMEAL